MNRSKGCSPALRGASMNREGRPDDSIGIIPAKAHNGWAFVLYWGINLFFMSSRRVFLYNSLVTALGYSLFSSSCKTTRVNLHQWDVPKELQDEMYAAALSIARKKIRGGSGDPVYKEPFVDAAFSSNIFYWDTCFIACYAKYHQDELPIANALDNFYGRMDDEGFISREYTKEGKTMWPKEHPVSVNPPLLAFAELELYEQRKDEARLRKVYPHLKKHFHFLVSHYQMEDRLFFSDAFGSGMDNIPRYPDGWKDDGKGIQLVNLYPEIFKYEGLSPAWNKQGRSVDMSAQMVLFARNLERIAGIIKEDGDKELYQRLRDQTSDAINALCWNEEDGFYYDLGYGKQIRRKHIGMFWTLISGVAANDKVGKMIKHLTDPKEFWRKIPVASYPADQKDFSPEGTYWLGSVWAPTNYMIIRGLQSCGRNELASMLAHLYYRAVAEVYKKDKTFYENYAPDSFSRGNMSRPDFCGWTGIVPIALYHEFIRK